MAYNKNLNIGPNNVVNISGSSIALTGSLFGTEVSGTTAQFTSFTASNFKLENDLYVSGGLTVGKYVQLLPVSTLAIPANQTASYIYTSGSTNDLYFTQYQPGTNFTNTTRLRWLESTLSTGLLHGGVLSTVNGTTTFSLTSGSGLIVTYNASTGSDPYPTINFVSWPAYVSQSLFYTGSAQITYISVAGDGQIIQSPTAQTFAEFKDRIVIGRVLHQSGSITNGATNTPPTAYGLAASTADFIRAIGPLKINGHFLAASGSSLSLTKTAGDSYVEGRNYSTDPNIPNIVLSAVDPAVTISKIYREHISASSPVIDTGVAGAGYTTVDPTRYQDANGNLQTVGGGNFTVQRVFWFPKAVNRALFVYYGQARYTNLDDAIAGITTENFTEGDNTKGSAILVGFLVMRGNATDFDTPNAARIYQASTFRGGGAGGGGGTGGGTTLPAGSSSYVQFNDVGSFGADSRFTFDKITHTLTVTGTGSFNQLSTGPLTASAAYISGNAVIDVSSTNAALRITQRGTGESIRVEDETNPDATPFVVDANGNVGIGTAAPNAKLNVSGVFNIDGNNTIAGTGLGLGDNNAGGFKWIQSYNSQPLHINQLGNNTIFNVSGGNVGIGESNPSVKLHVSGGGLRIESQNNTWGTINSSVSTANYMRFNRIDGTTALGYIGGGAGAAIGLGTANDLALRSDADLYFSAGGGTPVMFLSGNGNVGIATITPNAKLDVNGNAIVSGNLNVTGYITGTTIFLGVQGFPGVGSGSAGERANIAASSSLFTTDAITAGPYSAGNPAHPTYNFSTQPSTGMYYHNNNELGFAIGGIQAFRAARGAGYTKLAINGEVTPLGLIHATLTTASADTTRIVIENGAAGNTNLSYDLRGNQGLVSRFIQVPHNANAFGEWTRGAVFHVSGSDVSTTDTNMHYSAVTHKWYKNAGSGSADRIMTLNSSGNLGIGTSNPQERLVVNGNTIISGNLTVTGSTTLSTVSGTTAQFAIISGSAGLIQGDLRVLGTASIGQLNTITQQSLLIGDKYITILSGGVDHTGINGSGFLWGTSSGPGETTGALGEHAHVLYDASRDSLQIFPGLYVLGNASVSGNFVVTGSITELSTRKIKTNIQTVNNQLTAISKLNPVSYVRLDDGRKEYGFISEEVKEVYPEFVVGEGINYPKMVSVLVSAVKELTDKVEKQQSEIEILKNIRGNL